MRHLALQSLLVASSPRNIRESEGLCSSAGVQGAGPLVIAKRATLELELILFHEVKDMIA
jgi:hypothetical protein